jgi:hypothetical protein
MSIPLHKQTKKNMETERQERTIALINYYYMGRNYFVDVEDRKIYFITPFYHT